MSSTTKVSRTHPLPEHVPAPRVSTSTLAWAGLAGPVLFTVGFLVQERLRSGEYSPVAETVSALEAGPHGWVQQINFVVFGVLTVLFAVGLHRGMPASRAGWAGPALLVASGVGLVLAAVRPLREDAAGVTYDPGGHVVAGVLFFLGTAAALVALSRRAAHDPRWRPLAGYLLVSGAVAVAGFVLTRVAVMPDGAPLHDVAGLVQRLLLLVVLPARMVLAWRLLRLSGDDVAAR